MRVLVCGSRTWTDRHLIYIVLATLPADTTIIHGCARGADRIAAEYALLLGMAIDRPPTKNNPLGGYPISRADWATLGRRAGHIRNGIMLRDGHPDLAIAFHIANSPGTQDMLDQSEAAGVVREIYSPCIARIA